MKHVFMSYQTYIHNYVVHYLLRINIPRYFELCISKYTNHAVSTVVLKTCFSLFEDRNTQNPGYDAMRVEDYRLLRWKYSLCCTLKRQIKLRKVRTHPYRSLSNSDHRELFFRKRWTMQKNWKVPHRIET